MAQRCDNFGPRARPHPFHGWLSESSARFAGIAVCDRWAEKYLLRLGMDGGRSEVVCLEQLKSREAIEMSVLTRTTGFGGGRPVLRVLPEHGHMVVAVVPNAESAAKADGAGTEPVTGDIRNPSRARRPASQYRPNHEGPRRLEHRPGCRPNPARPGPVATTCAQAL